MDVVSSFLLIVALFSGSNIDSRDIVDGHREKTLSLLWKIIFTFHVSVWLCDLFVVHKIQVSLFTFLIFGMSGLISIICSGGGDFG